MGIVPVDVRAVAPGQGIDPYGVSGQTENVFQRHPHRHGHVVKRAPVVPPLVIIIVIVPVVVIPPVIPPPGGIAVTAPVIPFHLVGSVHIRYSHKGGHAEGVRHLIAPGGGKPHLERFRVPPGGVSPRITVAAFVFRTAEGRIRGKKQAGPRSRLPEEGAVQVGHPRRLPEAVSFHRAVRIVRHFLNVLVPEHLPERQTQQGY